MTSTQIYNKYVKYGLYSNPFPGNPDATSLLDVIEKDQDYVFPLALTIHNNTQRALNALAHRIFEENVYFIIGGQWGIGKTHLLLAFVKMVKEMAKSRGNIYNVKLVYLSPTPILSMKEVYKIILSESQRKYNISVNYTNVERGFEEVLKSKLREEDFLIILLDQLEQGIKESTFSDWNQIARNAWYNLDEIVRKINISRNKGTALGVAVYPELYSSFGSFPAGLFHKFELEVLTSKNEVKDLLIAYLKTKRLTVDELPKYILNPREIETLLDRISRSHGLYPFTEDAVNVLFNYSQGYPRNVLKMAFYALEYAVDQGVDFINGNVVLKAYPDAGNLAIYITATEKLIRAESEDRGKPPAFIITRTLNKAIQGIIIGAKQMRLLDIEILPHSLDPNDAKKLYGDKLRISKNYSLRDECTPITSADFKYMTILCISKRVSRPISAEDIIEYIDEITQLQESLSSLPINNFVLIGLTNLDERAWQYTSAFRAKNINFQFIHLDIDKRDEIGKLLCYGMAALRGTRQQSIIINELIKVCKPIIDRFSEKSGELMDIITKMLRLPIVQTSKLV